MNHFFVTFKSSSLPQNSEGYNTWKQLFSENNKFINLATIALIFFGTFLLNFEF